MTVMTDDSYLKLEKIGSIEGISIIYIIIYIILIYNSAAKLINCHLSFVIVGRVTLGLFSPVVYLWEVVVYVHNPMECHKSKKALQKLVKRFGGYDFFCYLCQSVMGCRFCEQKITYF